MKHGGDHRGVDGGSRRFVALSGKGSVDARRGVDMMSQAMEGFLPDFARLEVVADR